MTNLKLTYQEIKSRLTGFSLPFFGVSWQPDESEIKVARRIIAFLEDRRVLYSPHELEVPRHCIDSIQEIRKYLTEEIGKIAQRSELYDDLQFLRSSCRKFLDNIHSVRHDIANSQDFSSFSGWVFLTALGELRGVFGIGISKIATAYGLDVAGDLGKIIPIGNEPATSANLTHRNS
ncbi:DUF6650 family protein [Hymenobacter sp. PAMC 26628]|uniref:DUF6650 family protein n=1 Tax=Hymenobacter sp. PAMC 26628 TaxID=1484118 RepID=UPI0009020511|nr:DUF6650 family protein [Hymenobacter sp. PAMC 26628]